MGELKGAIEVGKRCMCCVIHLFITYLFILDVFVLSWGSGSLAAAAVRGEYRSSSLTASRC